MSGAGNCLDEIFCTRQYYYETSCRSSIRSGKYKLVCGFFKVQFADFLAVEETILVLKISLEPTASNF